jgi:hypothetical protein
MSKSSDAPRKPQSLADLQRQIREEGRRYERLRRPLSPEAVARLRGPELPQHVVAARDLRRAERQWREWQEQAKEARGPHWREDPDLALSAQHRLEHLAQLRGTLDYYLRERAAQQAVVGPQRKSKRGHPGAFTDAEIVHLQAYCRERCQRLKGKARLNKLHAELAELRKHLPKSERVGVDDSTMKRKIVQPVVRGKIP